MGGVGEGDSSSVIFETTASAFSKTSWFQKHNTVKPCPFYHASRSASLPWYSACCPPSASTIIFFSKDTKSTIYCPIGSCRLNVIPSTCFCTYIFPQQTLSSSHVPSEQFGVM